MQRSPSLQRLDDLVRDFGRLICYGQVSGFPRASDAMLFATTPVNGIALNVGGGNMVSAVAAGALGDANTANGALGAGLLGWNGTAWDRMRVCSAAEMAAVTKQFAHMVNTPGEWSIQNNPGTNTQATVSKAAGGAGVRHFMRSFVAALTSTGATASQQTVVIRDGASGAGTVLYTFDLSIPAVADNLAIFGLSGLNFTGSPNTAMTIEFTAAGGANTFETVSASGISTI